MGDRVFSVSSSKKKNSHALQRPLSYDVSSLGNVVNYGISETKVVAYGKITNTYNIIIWDYRIYTNLMTYNDHNEYTTYMICYIDV